MQEIWETASPLMKAFFALWAGLAFMSGVISSNKGYSFALGAVLSSLFSPIVGLVVVGLLKPKKGSAVDGWNKEKDSEQHKESSL